MLHLLHYFVGILQFRNRASCAFFSRIKLLKAEQKLNKAMQHKNAVDFKAHYKLNLQRFFIKGSRALSIHCQPIRTQNMYYSLTSNWAHTPTPCTRLILVTASLSIGIRITARIPRIVCSICKAAWHWSTLSLGPDT